jgi:hypothetical protein
MFDALNAAFPNHTHFYVVNGLSMADALDRCARMTGDDGQVFNYQNMIIFAVKHALDTANIPWLDPVSGSPVDVPQNDPAENQPE